MLTEITRIPYDAQHLPIRTIKFVTTTRVEFELQVERDADINGEQKVIGGEQQTDQITTGGGNDETDENAQHVRARTRRRAPPESAHADPVLRI